MQWLWKLIQEVQEEEFIYEITCSSQVEQPDSKYMDLELIVN